MVPPFQKVRRFGVSLCTQHLSLGRVQSRRWIASLLVCGLWGASGCLEESPADLEGMSRDGTRAAGPVNPEQKPADPAATRGASGEPVKGVIPGGIGSLPASPAVAAAPVVGASSVSQGPAASGGEAATAKTVPPSNAAPADPPSDTSGSTTSGRPTISEDHADVPRKTQEELQSASATLTLSGTIQCSICKGDVLINVVDSQGLLTRKVQAPGKFELTVPEGAGAASLTVIADQNGNGQPSKGEPLGFLSGGGLTLQQKDLAGLDITIQ